MSKRKPRARDVWNVKQPSKTVKAHVVDELVAAMLDGRLDMDSTMPPEPEMCGRLGVSRVAFREAVKQLEVLGFLRIDRGNGTHVQTPTFACMEPIIGFLGKSGRISLSDLHHVRMLIEVEAVRLVAQAPEAGLVAKLREILVTVEAHFDDERSHTELDYEFHQAILDACPNRLLSLLLSPFATQLRQSRSISFKGLESCRRTVEAHEGILDAIRKNAPERAAKRMRAHLEQTAIDLNLDGGPWNPQGD